MSELSRSSYPFEMVLRIYCNCFRLHFLILPDNFLLDNFELVLCFNSDFAFDKLYPFFLSVLNQRVQINIEQGSNFLNNRVGFVKGIVTY